jgi:glycosyltransferase involved in cell wall biosynthesis
MGIESTVIYPPVPWVAMATEWETKRKDFVWIGRIDPFKRLEDAIDIIAGLRNAGIECSLHIVGSAVDKGYLSSVVSLAKRMGDWVVLEGPIYGDAKASFLAQFRYAIHTRADEPFGITLVELMKAGCIPFAPNSCGSAEIVNHPALLFADKDEAVDKIRDVISDPGLASSVRSFLRHRAELFSTDRFCQSVRALVSGMIDSDSTAVEFVSSQIDSGGGRAHGN